MSALKSTLDPGLRHLCQSTQSVGLEDHVVASEEAPGMLQLSADPEKLAMYALSRNKFWSLKPTRNHLSSVSQLKSGTLSTTWSSALTATSTPMMSHVRRTCGRMVEAKLIYNNSLCCKSAVNYTETSLIALNSTPFAFGSVTDFSKYIAQTLLPTQISAISVLKCPFREIYFPGFGVNSAFIGLIRESLHGLKVLVLFGVRSQAVEEEAMRVIERKIAREIKEGCEELEVKVELTRNGLEWRKEVATIYGRGERSLGAE